MKKMARRSVSILLSLLMLVSVFSVGTITSSAAIDNTEAVGATRTYDGTEVMYFNMAGHRGGWWNDSGCYHYAYFFGTGSAWAKLCSMNNHNSSASANGSYYFTKVPAGTWTHVILVRNSTDAADWNAYNQTESIPLGATGNCIAAFDGGTSATWGNYALNPSAVTAQVTNAISGSGTSEDPYMVNAGESFTIEANVTFSPEDSAMDARYGFAQGTSVEASSITSPDNTFAFTAVSDPDTVTQYTVGARGYYGGTYSAASETETVYVKTVSSGPAVPTGLTFTPADNIVTGDGTSAASPLQYYSGKTAKITASASLPEGLTESETTYVEYAIGNQSGAQTEYVKDPSLVFNSISGDNTVGATHRYLYARTNTDGETSTAVSVVFYTKCVNITGTISTIAEKDESTSEIGVAFAGIYTYTGYGSAVVTIKDGETQIAQQTYTQEELAAQALNGALSVALTFPKITTAGEHPITAEITYEGVTAVSEPYVLPDPTLRTMEAVAYTEGEESTTGGTVQVSAASVLPGEEVTFTATANAEYQFKGWYSDETLTDLVSDQATYTLPAGEDNVKLYASFLKELYLRYHTGDDNITTVPMQWDAQNKYYYYDLTASQGTQYIYKITKTETSWENHNWNATPNAGGVECTTGISATGDFQVTAAESGKLTIIFLTDNTGRYLLEGIT
ncbi:MAG TPA: hypothetical protein IAD34_02425, partial [Candidatus Scatovicinus merdipullorum]|nr:hypothetical protein [Candidatus Scatovicinus merdipullorum]